MSHRPNSIVTDNYPCELDDHDLYFSQVSGIEPQNFRALPTDASTAWALSPSVLAAAIEEDKKAGKVPFFLSATVRKPPLLVSIISIDEPIWG